MEDGKTLLRGIEISDEGRHKDGTTKKTTTITAVAHLLSARLNTVAVEGSAHLYQPMN